MLVSILINNYNYARYLAFCLDSALAQTYPDVEVILYDDGSTDDSVEVAQAYGPRITLLANPNHGRKPSFNQANAIHKAFHVSKGEIICLLDSDDAFTPEKVAAVVAAFEDDAELLMVQHRAVYIDGNGEPLSGKPGEIFTTAHPFRVMRLTGRVDRLFYQTSSLSFRRDYFAAVLPLVEDGLEKIWPDLRLSREASLVGKIRCLDERLTLYRRHDANDSLKVQDPVHFADLRLQFQSFLDGLTAKYGRKRVKVSGGSLFYLITPLRQLLYLLLGPDSFRTKRTILKDLLSRFGSRR